MPALVVPPLVKAIGLPLALIILWLLLVEKRQRRGAASLAEALGATAHRVTGAWKISGVWDETAYICRWYLGGDAGPSSSVEVTFEAHSRGSFTVCRNAVFGPGSFSSELGIRSIDAEQNVRTGDADFDDAFFISTVDARFTSAFFSDAGRRDAVRALFACGATKVNHDGKTMAAHLRARGVVFEPHVFDARKVQAMMAPLALLARSARQA
jgi:hypothetical protein